MRPAMLPDASLFAVDHRDSATNAESIVREHQRASSSSVSLPPYSFSEQTGDRISHTKVVPFQPPEPSVPFNGDEIIPLQRAHANKKHAMIQQSRRKKTGSRSIATSNIEQSQIESKMSTTSSKVTYATAVYKGGRLVMQTKDIEITEVSFSDGNEENNQSDNLGRRDLFEEFGVNPDNYKVKCHTAENTTELAKPKPKSRIDSEPRHNARQSSMLHSVIQKRVETHSKNIDKHPYTLRFSDVALEEKYKKTIPVRMHANFKFVNFLFLIAAAFSVVDSINYGRVYFYIKFAQVGTILFGVIATLKKCGQQKYYYLFSVVNFAAAVIASLSLIILSKWDDSPTVHGYALILAATTFVTTIFWYRLRDVLVLSTVYTILHIIGMGLLHGIRLATVPWIASALGMYTCYFLESSDREKFIHNEKFEICRQILQYEDKKVFEILQLLYPRWYAEYLRTEPLTSAPYFVSYEGISIVARVKIRDCPESAWEQRHKTLRHAIEILESISERHELTKVKTLNNIFLAVTGVFPGETRLDAEGVISCIRDIKDKVSQESLESGTNVDIVLGVSVGSVYGGIVTSSTKTLDVFGPGVDTAFELTNKAVYLNISNAVNSRFARLLGETSLIKEIVTLGQSIHTINFESKYTIVERNGKEEMLGTGLISTDEKKEMQMHNESKDMYPTDQRTKTASSVSPLLPQIENGLGHTEGVQKTGDNHENEDDIQDIRWSYWKSHSTLHFAKYHQYLSVVIFYITGIIETSFLIDYELLKYVEIVWIPFLRFILFGPVLVLTTVAYTLYTPYVKTSRKWRRMLPYVANTFYYIYALHFVIRNEIFLRSSHSHIISAPRLRFFTYDMYLWIGIYATFPLSSYTAIRNMVFIWVFYASYLYAMFPAVTGSQGFPWVFIAIYPATLGVAFWFLSRFKEKTWVDEIQAQKKHKQEAIQLRDERDYLEELLLSIVPRSVYASITSGKATECERYEWTPVVSIRVNKLEECMGNQSIGARMDIINEMLNIIAEIASQSDMELIKGLGTTAIVIPKDQQLSKKEKLDTAVHYCFQMHEAFSMYVVPHSDSRVMVTMGISCGCVTGGIYGRLRFGYDITGEIVEEATSLSHSCHTGKIRVSEHINKEIQECESKGYVVERERTGDETAYYITANKDVWAMFVSNIEWAGTEELADN